MITLNLYQHWALAVRSGAILFLAAGLFWGAGAAQASTITASDVTPGVSSVNLSFATVTAAGGLFSLKTSGDNYTSFGVGGGYVNGEIDMSGESVTVTYTAPTVITQMVLASLYPGGASAPYNDAANEVAQVVVTLQGGSTVTYMLTATGATTYTWTGLGSVTNSDPAVYGDAALWSIKSPFGTQAITQIVFSSVSNGGGLSGLNSDFSIYKIDSVPEASTTFLVAAALLGLGLAGRRKFVRR